jgi:hypothetical protein
MHSPAIPTQMTARHWHWYAGSGHPSGAQQRKVGWPTVVHAVVFGVESDWHVHALTEVAKAGPQSVTLSAQTSLQCVATQVDRAACAPLSSVGLCNGTQ